MPAESICAFWLGRRCFGLDVGLVGEVVAVEAMIPVPLAPPAVKGIFNLRGTPTTLVDLGEVLALPDAADGDAATRMALVLRHGDLQVAARIDRMEAVLGRAVLTPPAGTREHPAVAGFHEAEGRVVTVLEPRVLLERLEALRYRKTDEE